MKFTDELKDKLGATVSETIKTAEDYERIRRTLRRKAQSDFWFFCYHVLDFQDMDNPFHINFCERYQKRISRNFNIYLMPRGHLKTTCITVAGSIFALIQDWFTLPSGKKVRGQNLRILIGNAKLENAIDIVADIKHVFTSNEFFAWLFPEYIPDETWIKGRGIGKWTQERIDLPCSKLAGRKEGNIQVISTGASKVSKHYDIIKLDDVVNDENIDTKILRDKTESWYKNMLQLRNDPITSIVEIVGTRWHYDDLYGRLINKELARRNKAKEDGKDVVPVYLIYRRKAKEDGEPIWPERFTSEELDRLKYEELGAYKYSCQYDNDPVPEEDAKFQRNHIKFIDNLDIPTNVVNFAAVDMADEDTTNGDFYVVTIGSFDVVGKMYIREIIRGRFSQFEFLNKVYNACLRWKPVRVGVETTGFQKGILRGYKAQANKNGWFIPWVEINRGKTSKFTRTIGLQPRVERGDFYIEENIPNLEWAIEEMITFPKGVHDDILDTFVDLENIYYAASDSHVIQESVDPNTFDGYFGKLENATFEESEEQDFLSVEGLFA